LRERLSARGEEALGELAQVLLDNPWLNQALHVAFEARDKASQAGAQAMKGLNLPTAAETDRLERRLRSVSELRVAMYKLGDLSPRFQIKDRDCEQPCPWDGEWFYHFRGSGYETIEWVDLKSESSKQREAVRMCLKEINVPGIETGNGFRVFGWVRADEQVAYIR
jgi:hypothetical protein